VSSFKCVVEGWQVCALCKEDAVLIAQSEKSLDGSVRKTEASFRLKSYIIYLSVYLSNPSSR
jgi:hypothetical protein